jgi:hypothetical protein
VFPGSGLEKHETTLVYDHSDAEVLAHSSTSEDGGWLRFCYQHAGETQCRTMRLPAQVTGAPPDGLLVS